MTTDATEALVGTERARLELCSMAAEVSALTERKAAIEQPEWVSLRSGGRQVTWVWMTPGNHGVHLIDKGGKLALGAWNHDTGERADVKFSPAMSGIPAAFLAGALSIIMDRAFMPEAKESWAGQAYAVTMSHADLVTVLTDILDRVTRGDSLEGNVSWMIPEDEGAPAGSFDVTAAYRVGNLMGQGGMRMIHRDQAAPAPCAPCTCPPAGDPAGEPADGAQ